MLNFYRIISFFIFLFCGFSPLLKASSDKEEGIRLYQEYHFKEAIPVLQKILTSMPEDDQICYLLALSYAQTQKPLESAQTLKPLLEKDPSYYLYKINFDSDFGPVRGLEVFRGAIQGFRAFYLAEDQRTGDKIAQIGDQLYLYHNGLKVLLTEKLKAQFKVFFIDEDVFYYTWNSSPEEGSVRKKKVSVHSGLSFYSRNQRKEIPLMQRDELLSRVEETRVQGDYFLIGQFAKDFFIYRINSQMIPRQFGPYSGTLHHVDAATGLVEYEEPNKKASLGLSRQIILSDLLLAP